MTHVPTETTEAPQADISIYGIETNSTFCAEVERLCGENVMQCYQCGKCTAGCPAVFAMDHTPNMIMRMVQLGCEKSVLESETIWICASCETCATRCPLGLSVAKVMDACREMSRKKNIRSGEPKVSVFHKEFLAEVARNGRVHELTMIALYKMKSRNLFSDIPLGIKMFLKGKLALIPFRVKGLGEVRKLFKKTME